MAEPTESERLIAEREYREWCNLHGRDPEDVGSMVDYEDAVHEWYEDRHRELMEMEMEHRRQSGF